jgi:peptidoglycan hydrolase-like protein with peptidoglycan-binding domain
MARSLPRGSGSFFAATDEDEIATSESVRRRRRPLGRQLSALGALVVTGVAATVLLPTATANADPSANDWYRLRMCESGNNYSINTGNDHYGAYQFDLSTWRSVGGSGYPYQASPGEQDARALILYRERGWQPWQCAAIVGLQNDSDAGSGIISDIHVPGGGSGGGGSGGGGGSSSTDVPAFPGSRSYVLGDHSSTIEAFQNQMHRRGYFPPGTGRYGPQTAVLVKRLQLLNGLQGTGTLGPKTWRAAFVGKYSLPSTARSGVPPYPGVHSFSVGDTNPIIRAFQNQMHARGVFPAGTGHYGPQTLAMIKRLQRLNGIRSSGLLGPKTWRAAWVGKYTRP